ANIAKQWIQLYQHTTSQSGNLFPASHGR
ncbi:MAG: hypothetical protein RL329_2506, partial [Bacteroidota bacterium]